MGRVALTEIVPRPKDTNVVSCKWVYRVKYGANGKVTRYKAQLIARGFTQIHGLDYSETFVAKNPNPIIIKEIVFNYKSCLK